MSWTVLVHPQARAELRALPSGEQAALDNVMKKLEALGPALGYPHSSNVQGADRLRELRPRAGRSRWRALYRRIGDVYVIVAIGPEAQVDGRKFRRAVAAGERRADEVEPQ